MIVVAPQSFHPALREYIRFKQQQRPVELIALERILRSKQGVDDPEKLKRFLYQKWRKGGIGFALLVGDVDVMPVRYMVLDRVTPAAMDYAFYPSDLYYSDLARSDGSFDNWNAQTNSFHAGYFGEVRGEKNKEDPVNYDAVDYLPDIAVGRWPVSTPKEVRLIADKSMRFEKEVLFRPAVEGRSAAFIAVGGWVDCRSQMDRWAREMASGWNVRKFYYKGKGPARVVEGPPTHENVCATFNNGASLVVHTGHGQPDAWEQCFNVADLDKITNSASLPVVISAGCSTSYFAPLAPYDAYTDVHGTEHKGTDKGQVFRAPPPMAAPYQKGKFNPTGLGEQMLKRNLNGAVVYIGCNTGSQPCALDLVEGFLSALNRAKNPSIGESWAEAIRYYYKKRDLPALKPDSGWYPPSIFFQGMKFMFFGDPSLPFFAGGE